MGCTGCTGNESASFKASASASPAPPCVLTESTLKLPGCENLRPALVSERKLKSTFPLESALARPYARRMANAPGTQATLDLPALESWLWEAARIIRGPVDAVALCEGLL